MKKSYLKNIFLTGHFRATLLTFRKLDIQTFNSKHLNPSANSNNSVLISIVGTLYFISRNVNFVFMIMFSGLQLLQEQFLACKI